MSELVRKARRVSAIVELMGCDKATVKRMLEDGRLEGYRIGWMCYVYLDSVKKFQLDNDCVAGAIDKTLDN